MGAVLALMLGVMDWSAVGQLAWQLASHSNSVSSALQVQVQTSLFTTWMGPGGACLITVQTQILGSAG
jgi:hypothetical protein